MIWFAEYAETTTSVPFVVNAITRSSSEKENLKRLKQNDNKNQKIKSFVNLGSREVREKASFYSRKSTTALYSQINNTSSSSSSSKQYISNPTISTLSKLTQSHSSTAWPVISQNPTTPSSTTAKISKIMGSVKRFVHLGSSSPLKQKIFERSIIKGEGKKRLKVRKRVPRMRQDQIGKNVGGVRYGFKIQSWAQLFFEWIKVVIKIVNCISSKNRNFKT